MTDGEPVQKSFWLRGDLARKVDDRIRASRGSSKRLTWRQILNDAVKGYLEAESTAKAKTRP